MRAPPLAWQLTLAFLLTFLFLVGLIGWLQNVHILTANGMYKSIQAEPWIHDFADAQHCEWINRVLAGNVKPSARYFLRQNRSS